LKLISSRNLDGLGFHVRTTFLIKKH
jgi:hypothetical protein